MSTPIERRTIYSRPEDMSPDGTLSLIMQDDGDVIVTCTAWDRLDDRLVSTSIEFCTGIGGGRSPKTRAALVELMMAIQQDNGGTPAYDQSVYHPV